MTERILVSVAWPYANGSIHIGQVAGCYLPADIFARYHRMNGNEVLMVSGADAHGTPVTLTAEQRGTSPDQVSSGYQAEFLDNWERLGISFDLFTSTHTDNHTAVVQEMFLTLLNNGYIYKDTMMQPYCETDSRFLADRYVEGTCPHCGTDGARGDQCDSCGRTLDPKDLIGMACRLCGGRARDQGDGALLPQAQRFRRTSPRVGRGQDALEAERPQLHPRLPGRRPARSGHHPGHRVGRARPVGRIRHKEDIRLVRGCNRVPVGV